MLAKVVVTWIHVPERDDNFENSGETVLRFLRDAYGPKTRTSSALEIVPSDLAQGGRYLTALNCSQKLPWQERHRNWERWTTALPQPNSHSEARQIAIRRDLLPFAIGSEKPAQMPEDSTDATPGWSLARRTDTRVIFGHVVFARPKMPAAAAQPAEPPSALDRALPRTFVPVLPALSSLDFTKNLYEEGLWHTHIIIRFVPSPDIPAELAASAPNLELAIEADHREIKRLVHLRAVTDTFAGDVLFPAGPVDARFLQRRYYTLLGRSIEHHAPAMHTFLAKSDLRPWDGKLNTPPCLFGLRLPRWLLSSPAPAPTTVGEADEPVEVNYNLASIEVQRTVVTEYEGLKLRYINIQGGQRGGERSEISLDAVRVEENDETLSGPGKDAKREEDGTLPVRFADEIDSRSRGQFVSHVMAGQRNEADEPAVPPKPVEVAEFLRIASSIAQEEGHLKWHAGRS